MPESSSSVVVTPSSLVGTNLTSKLLTSSTTSKTLSSINNKKETILNNNNIFPSKKPSSLVEALLQDPELEEGEEESWPKVDVGNIICDLDADIDKEQEPRQQGGSKGLTQVRKEDMSSPSSSSQGSEAAATSSAPSISVSSGTSSSFTKTSTTMGGLSGGSQTTTMTADSSSKTSTATATTTTTNGGSNSNCNESSTTPSSNHTEKSLKMKIKRTKSGCTRNPEGKLEIVNNDNSVTSSSHMNGDSKMSTDGSVKSAMLTSSVGKVKLSTSSTSTTTGTAALSKMSHNKSVTNGKISTTTNGANKSNGQAKCDPPAAKKLKVDAGVSTEIATMTEPDSLGPMDPGSSVSLEGIVWHETDNGVLVINVTWRGKTYVGTLLDSTKHVNQWAPPRYTDSPTSDLESGRGGKRGGKRGGRGASGTPVDSDGSSTSRKNLRSSKAKRNNNSSSFPASPAKRSKDDNKGMRNSSRNTPDEEDPDSEGEKKENNSNGDNASSDNNNGKKEENNTELTPKDSEEEKYVPPPPLPYALTCPKSGCKKKYRHHNGLKFHVSHAHKELMSSNGEIMNREEIEKLEAEKAKKKAEEEQEKEKKTVASTAITTNTPATITTSTSQQAPLAALSQLKPNFTPRLPVSEAKPMPVSMVMDGLNGSNNKQPLLPNNKAALTPSSKSIRPPTNARPIVPATAPQLITPGGLPSAINNLKPIQPRPTIMADPTPNLALEELRRMKKEPKKKKENPNGSSPGTSPPRTSVSGSSSGSPKAASKSVDGKETENSQQQVKSPAYSDISDDNEDTDKSKNTKAAPNQTQQSTPSTSSLFQLGALASIPTPSPPTSKGSPKPNDARMPSLPGTLDYQKMLAAYGLPPLPSGMDPNLQLQLLAANPASYKLPGMEKDNKLSSPKVENSKESLRKTPEDLRKRNSSTPGPGSGNLSVKPEFGIKTEASGSKADVKKNEEEGAKPTMETRGPPPGTNAYGYMNPSMLRPPPGFPPGFPYDLAGVNPLLLAAAASSSGGAPYNPYLPPHLQASVASSLAVSLRPPFSGAPITTMADLLRAPFLPPSSSSLPEDLSRQLSSPVASMSSTKALDLLQHHANQIYNNQKIQELQERALKSPNNRQGKSSPKPTDLNNAGRKSSPSPRASSVGPQANLNSMTMTTSSASLTNSGKSPPPMRHVHTHTHAHFGLGYPMLPPSMPGMPPPPTAHSSLPSGFPSSLLPPKSAIPGFPPPK